MEELFEIILAKWNVIEEIVDILAIPLLSTLNFTLPDFYECWIKMEIELKQRNLKPNQQTQSATILQRKLQQRK